MTAAPSAFVVAGAMLRQDIDGLRRDAAALGFEPDALALAGARCVAAELRRLVPVILRRLPIRCSSARCEGSGEIGTLTIAQRRLVRQDPICYALRCGDCIDRVAEQMSVVIAARAARRAS